MNINKNPRVWRRTRIVTGLVVALATASACNSDDVTTPGPVAPRGVVVLDGFVQPGLTLLGDTGTASSRLAFGAPSEFDGGFFSLTRDTAVAVSSRGAGDLLYIADLKAGTVRKIQLPTGGNGARARLITGGNGSARVLVSLRDSSMVLDMLVSSAGVATITRMNDAGKCPVDAFRHGNATWVVDANADCKNFYAVEGAVRLIRIPDVGESRDTITLTSLRGSGASAIVQGDVAIISADGEADFSTTPYTSVSPGAVAKVDLTNRTVQLQKAMPAGSYMATTRLGLDGDLYVSFYESLATFTDRIMQLRIEDLAIATSAPTAPGGWRLLSDESDEEMVCGTATADALGRLHCLSFGASSATTLHVFNPNGKEIRRVAAGQGGVDIALRP